MTEPEPVEPPTPCLDCRCFLTRDNRAVFGNDSAYCDYCLRDRVQAGERVPGGTYTNPETGRTEHWFHVVCTRCKGTGEYIVSATQDGNDCFGCLGNGFVAVTREGVQQTARWWQTYLTNREPGKRPAEKPPTRYPRRR